MRKAENMNAPNLWGWAIGLSAGLVAFGVLLVVGDFDFFPAAALSAVVAGAAGLVLGLPWGAGTAKPGPVAMPAKASETAAAPAKPATAAPGHPGLRSMGRPVQMRMPESAAPTR